MRPGDNKGLSLFMRMLTAFLAVVILVSGVLTWAFYVFSRRSIEQHTAENILQQFKTLEYHFGFESREDIVKDLRVLAANPVLDEYIMSSPVEREVGARAVERLFLGGMKYHENYESVYFVNSLGMEGVRVDRSGRVKKYRDMSENRLFTRIKSGPPGGVNIVGPWKDNAGRVVASIGIHKVDQDIGKFGGVLIIDWSLDGFIDYLGKIKIFDENLIWLFSGDGTLLKQPRTIGETLDPRPYLSKDIQSEPRLLQVKEGLLVYQDLSVLPGKPLVRLAIGVPLSLLLTDVRSTLRFFSIVFLFALLMTSSITLYLSRYLSMPITVLAAAAARLAKGDLSTQVAVTATGEVQKLVDSFNQMARDLEKTTVSKEYVDNIIRSMIDTLIVASPDGTIRTVNEAACSLLGYREEELTGQPIKLIFADDTHDGSSVFDELIKYGLIKNAECTYLAKDRRKIPVLFSSSAIYYGNATAHGIVCVAVDITKRKRAEEALKRSSEELQRINEELKNFAYIVSHDLRAPLVNIKGFSDELGRSIQELTPLLEKYREHVDAGEKQRTEELLKKDIPEALGFIGFSVTRMDALINSILKLSRLGRNELKPELVRTVDIVQTLLKSLTHQIDMHKAEVTIGPLPDLIIDKTAAEQIFGNLLDNALKYLEPARPGKIEITAEQNTEEVIFRVRDNGRGIAKEDTQKVFELFRRVGRRDVTGHGMGLTYVKTLIKRLGGRIWCESELGVESTFIFTIPNKAHTEKKI